MTKKKPPSKHKRPGPKKKTGPKPGLNPKQQKFAELYLTHNNATQAYADAYDRDISDPEVYKKVASSACTLLKNKHVREFIASKMDTLAKKVGLTQSKLLVSMKNIAESNIVEIAQKLRVYTDSHGDYRLDVSKISDDEGKRIKKLKINVKTGVVEVELYPADQMLTKLYEMIGYSKEEKETTNNNLIVWKEEKEYENKAIPDLNSVIDAEVNEDE